MHKQSFVTCCLFLLVMSLVLAQPAHAQIEYVGVDDAQGFSKAVAVRSRHLVFTSQIFPINFNGKVIGANDIAKQTQTLLAHLESALQTHVEAKLENVAKLNVYITDVSAAPKVRAEIAKAFPAGRKPAVSFVVTPLRVAGSLVSIDAVATDRRELPADARSVWEFSKGGNGANSRFPDDYPVCMVVVPADRLILVSGQAEPGEMRNSVRKTCESLLKTVRWVGGEQTAIAHVKVFMNSLNDVDAVVEELENAGMERAMRSISFVQWTNNGPPEIEVIASQWGGDANTNKTDSKDYTAPIRFLTPPWMTESPVYSKVTVTNSDRLIFTSGFYGAPNTNGETQVKSLFAELEQVAKEAGSDLRHLAKATYYITDDDVGKQLNALRPKYYDPKRPPAASKASVKGVGADGCTITLDMIAVPVGKP